MSCALKDTSANSSEEKMPCYSEDRKRESESIVKVIVVNDNRGREDDPDWNDSSGS